MLLAISPTNAYVCRSYAVLLGSDYPNDIFDCNEEMAIAKACTAVKGC
jgi:hypothetical protein